MTTTDPGDTPEEFPPLPPDATPGHIAYRGYVLQMLQDGGSEQPWDNLPIEEQVRWEAAIQFFVDYVPAPDQ